MGEEIVNRFVSEPKSQGEILFASNTINLNLVNVNKIFAEV